MKKNKLIETIQVFTHKADRSKTELFLINLLHYKLELFTKKSYSTEELRTLMSELPHFAPDEQFMMLNTYEQKQIFRAYKEVFLSVINQLHSFPLNEIKLLIHSYLELSSAEDLIFISKVIQVKDIAA